jgi:hypothetical protein
MSADETAKLRHRLNGDSEQSIAAGWCGTAYGRENRRRLVADVMTVCRDNH